MRSEILTTIDLQKAIDEWNWQSKIDEGAVQENIYQIGLKYKFYEKGNDVRKDDIVSVSLQGETKKFNRTVQIHVGSNLFDRELEEELIGKEVGKTYSFLHSTGKVDYVILECSRLVVPFLSDDMVIAENIEGVDTAQKLYLHFKKKELQEKIQDESFTFVDKFVSLCSYRVEEEDVKTFEELEMERCRKISEGMGMVFDEMSESELLGAVGCRNIAEFRKMLRALFTKEIKASLYMEKMFQAKRAENFDDVLGNYVGLLDIVRERVFHKLMEEAV